uniref:Uncharacterized protein n=1 Tax=Gongylonema pulchrum TaxID=637853 RepID=A0A183CYD0_9BILA
LMEPLRKLDIETHRRMHSYLSLPEYVLADDVLGSAHTDFIQELCTGRPFVMIDADDDDDVDDDDDDDDDDGADDAPCCSKQHQACSLL